MALSKYDKHSWWHLFYRHSFMPLTWSSIILIIPQLECFMSISVTRFCEISPLWQNFKRLWQSLNGLSSIWQIFYSFRQNFSVLHGQILKK